MSLNGLLYYAPVINGVGYSEVITNISNMTSQAYVTQQIFNKKAIEALYSKSFIQSQSLRVSYKISENDLRKAITLQYLAAYTVSNGLTFNRELQKSSAEEEKILVQLVDKGLYRQVDYSSFLVALKGQELQQLYKELKMTEDIIPQINQQLDLEESVIKQQKSLINMGDISIIDYVNTLKNYIAIKMSINQYQLKILQIITEINYWNQ